MVIRLGGIDGNIIGSTAGEMAASRVQDDSHNRRGMDAVMHSHRETN